METQSTRQQMAAYLDYHCYNLTTSEAEMSHVCLTSGWKVILMELSPPRRLVFSSEIAGVVRCDVQFEV